MQYTGSESLIRQHNTTQELKEELKDSTKHHGLRSDTPLLLFSGRLLPWEGRLHFDCIRNKTDETDNISFSVLCVIHVPICRNLK